MFYGRDLCLGEKGSGGVSIAVFARSPDAGRGKGGSRGGSMEGRPFPKAQLTRSGVASGRGIACVAYEGDNGYAALVVELEVNQNTGQANSNRLRHSQDGG